jgi:hypothetical protein
MRDWRTVVRAVTSVLLAATVIVIFVRGGDRAGLGSPAFEHVGVIEAYVEAGFQAIVVIGIAVAIYIGTRAGDLD